MFERGDQGQPGPIYPKVTLAHINPTGDLPSVGTNKRGPGK